MAAGYQTPTMAPEPLPSRTDRVPSMACDLKRHQSNPKSPLEPDVGSLQPIRRKAASPNCSQSPRSE
jgi:hypothetical protein